MYCVIILTVSLSDNWIIQRVTCQELNSTHTLSRMHALAVAVCQTMRGLTDCMSFYRPTEAHCQTTARPCQWSLSAHSVGPPSAAIQTHYSAHVSRSKQLVHAQTSTRICVNRFVTCNGDCVCLCACDLLRDAWKVQATEFTCTNS